MTQRRFVRPLRLKPLFMTLILSSLCLLWVYASSAVACYWDKDTLASEKRKFPGVLEMITGRFKRHSLALYQWRISDRRQRLQETPDQLPLMDDLAVALDKTGAHEEAAQVMLRALKLDPNRYETHANLGTIYIHSGDFSEGLKHIDRALEINPQAHFGREIIQRELVRYVLKTRLPSRAHPSSAERLGDKTSKDTLPGRDDDAPPRVVQSRFSLPIYRNQRGDSIKCARALEKVWSKFERLKRKKVLDAKEDELSCPGLGAPFGFAAHLKAQKISFKDGIKGVMGMMRFSNHQHPILLEALGDLLLAHRSLSSMGRKDAKQLASRAYLSAAHHTHGQAAQRYQAKGLMALVGTRKKLSFMQVQARFRREVAQGERFFERHTRRERRLIKRGKRPE